MNRVYILFVFQLLSFVAYTQTDSAKQTVLFVGYNKTSSVIFPQAVKSIDRGSKDLFVQKVPGAENIVQLKAAKSDFMETNITVITVDGKLYEFAVKYMANPPLLSIQKGDENFVYDHVAEQKKMTHGVKDESYEMSLQLNGVFIKEDILYFQFELKNQSNISYDLDMLRFYTRDKKQSRRTSIQQLDQLPLYIFHRPEHVGGQSSLVFVAAFSKFTIQKKQLFCVQLMEKNGGRHLALKISNKKIVGASLL